jgi:hypothetical protein
MIVAKIINRLLHPFNLFLTRVSSVDKLHKDVLILNSRLAETRSSVSREELLKIVSELRIELIRHQISMKWNMIDILGKDKLFVAGRRRRCPLCDHEDFEDRFRVYRTQCHFGGGELVRFQCPSCDLIFGADKIFQLTETELASEYEWHYRAYSEGDSTAQELRSFHALKPSKSGLYLNYGAGAWSNTMQLLKSEGWDVYAYEPCASATSGNTYVINDKSVLSTMKFDGIFSNNLLEHLRQPVEELVFMKSLLKPNAAMSHSTACFAYLYEYTRFHLYFYLGRSREVLARKAGLLMYDFIEDGEFMNVIYKPMQT